MPRIPKHVALAGSRWFTDQICIQTAAIRIVIHLGKVFFLRSFTNSFSRYSLPPLLQAFTHLKCLIELYTDMHCHDQSLQTNAQCGSKSHRRLASALSYNDRMAGTTDFNCGTILSTFETRTSTIFSDFILRSKTMGQTGYC